MEIYLKTGKKDGVSGFSSGSSSLSLPSPPPVPLFVLSGVLIAFSLLCCEELFISFWFIPLFPGPLWPACCLCAQKSSFPLEAFHIPFLQSLDFLFPLRQRPSFSISSFGFGDNHFLFLFCTRKPPLPFSLGLNTFPPGLFNVLPLSFSG